MKRQKWLKKGDLPSCVKLAQFGKPGPVVNQTVLIGFLGQDPEYRNDILMVKLRVATRETYLKDEEEITKTEWHNCTAWGSFASRIAASLKKKDRVIVIGKNSTKSWETATGEKRTSAEIMIQHIGQLI